MWHISLFVLFTEQVSQVRVFQNELSSDICNSFLSDRQKDHFSFRFKINFYGFYFFFYKLFLPNRYTNLYLLGAAVAWLVPCITLMT